MELFPSFSSVFFVHWLACLLSTPAIATGYSLVANADSSNFFSVMNFVPSFADSDGIRDYTNGFVNYLTEGAAFSTGCATIENDQVRLAVDSTTILDQNLPVDDPNYGRNSVQLESSFTFDNGLLILDFTHMPPAVCGVWSAFWTINNDADGSGSGTTALYAEIDIAEGANNQATNVVSLHTDQREICSFNGNDVESGTRGPSNCQLDGANASGCEVEGPDGSYGEEVNRVGGGVYAVELTASWVKVWFIPRFSIPDDVINGNPNPDNWQAPIAVYDTADGDCDIEKIFKTQTTILNMDFCGDNGDTTWALGDNSCRERTGLSSCNEYVAKNPDAFSETYWEINSLKLYQ